MIYARVHDQTVADDYFAAMRYIEQRLDIVPVGSGEEEKYEIVKVPERTQVLMWVEQLAQPELGLEDRLSVVAQLRELFGLKAQHAPPEESAITQPP